MLYLAVSGRTPQQNSLNDFVSVEAESDEAAMQVEVNKPLDYEKTPEYTLLLRASVSGA